MRSLSKLFVVVVALALAMAPGTAEAQSLGLGIKGGLSRTNLAGEDTGPVGYTTGISFGAFATISAGSRLAIQPELLYTEKGTEYTGSSDNYTYIEAPLLIRYNLGLPLAPFKPYLFAGPSAGLLMSAEIGGDDVKDLYNSTEFAFTVGSGVEFGRFTLDARFQHGFTSIHKKLGDRRWDEKNRVISLLFGYRFF